jgi:hypothetical protein
VGNSIANDWSISIDSAALDVGIGDAQNSPAMVCQKTNELRTFRVPLPDSAPKLTGNYSDVSPEALGGDRARPFPVAGGVPAVNERTQPLPLVDGEVSIFKVLGNLGDVAQIQGVLALPIFVCFAERYNGLGHWLICSTTADGIGLRTKQAHARRFTSPRDMTDLSTDLPPSPLPNALPPRGVPRDMVTRGLLAPGNAPI